MALKASGPAMLLAGTLALVVGMSRAEPAEVPAPGARDTCPVCGMFVAKYPAWVATVLYRDGTALHFDGAKDLFKYLMDIPKWSPERDREDIRDVAVTEYYGLTRIDARNAWYVIGSDVLGPMGHEPVPLATREEAEEFGRDHQGKRILRFEEIDRALLRRLDTGAL
uniref:Nitrous oxide reductase accessory protein NosL n=1 Tax=Candidatus Kentrum sp. DK TaxID=2126562 RepID=A0A450T985_9GAMM|nr:MAG: Nitrous oxide reductase accessory protein NosL [Candidatus Kentron sp. DK]